MTGTKARKGDAVLIEHTTTNYRINAPTRTVTSYSFHFVASATRDGVVKAVADGPDAQSVSLERTISAGRRWIIGQGQCDVAGLLAAFDARQWPGRDRRSYDHGRYPFASVDEAKDFARAFVGVRA